MGRDRRGWLLVKVAGLLVLAALSLSAWIEAASAIASETTLCETNANSPLCERASRYPGITAEAELAPGTTAKLVVGTTTVLCSESRFSLETPETSGEPLPGVMSSPTFGACETTSGAPCSAGFAALGYAAETSWAVGNDGTITLGELPPGGQPRIKVGCGSGGAIVNCAYREPTVGLEIEGGNPALIRATSVALTKEGGLLCTPKLVWSAAYEVTSPSPLHVQTARETTFCETNTSSPVCMRPNRLEPGGFEASSPASSAKFGIGASTVSCVGSGLGGETLEASGEPLLAPVGFFSFFGCKTGGTACTAEPTNLPYEASFEWTSGDDGVLVLVAPGGEIFLQVSCAGSNCSYSAAALEFAVEGGNPAQFVLPTTTLAYAGGFLCPPTASFSVSYEMLVPSPVYLEHT